MKKLDTLVVDFLGTYKMIEQNEVSKTYSKDVSSYRRLFLSRHALIAKQRMTTLQKPLKVYRIVACMLLCKA